MELLKIIGFVFSISLKKIIEIFIDFSFFEMGRLKVEFIETKFQFVIFNGGLPTNIKIVKKEDSPTSGGLSFKIKFTNKSVKAKLIHNLNLILKLGNNIINPKEIYFSLNGKKENINTFTVDKSIPVYLNCIPRFTLDDLLRISKNNKVIFSYSIEDKIKTIETKLSTYSTDKGNLPLF